MTENKLNRETEEWLPVAGYEKHYEVSSHGRVRSIDRIVERSDGKTQTIKGRMRKLKTTWSGHQQIPLKVSGKTSWAAVHRLVLTAFNGPCPDGMEGCHNDGNPANNHIDNLRWDTRSNNAYDKGLHGTDHSRSKTHCNHGHPLESPNLVRYFADRGVRNCLACNRARAHIQRNPSEKPRIKEISDSYYEKIATE